MERFVAGIDFGTSNSSASISNGKTTKIVPLEDGKPTIPTTIYIERNHTSFGRAAKAKYTDGVNPNGRLIRSIKRILGTNTMNTGTTIEGRYITYKEIIKKFLQYIKQEIDNTAGHSVDAVVMGRPVHFDDKNPDADIIAEQTLAEIAHEIGFSQVSFQYEPVAAAFAHEQNITTDKLAMIIDIGGGTSDFSVIRLSPKKHTYTESCERVLSSTGIQVGGNDFDKSLALASFMPHFGQGTYYSPSPGTTLQIPIGIFHTLSTWNKINDLYNYKTLNIVHSWIQTSAAPSKISTLYEIISQNLGHQNLDYVESAKISLSDRKQKELGLDFLSTCPTITILRDDFEISIENHMTRIRDCILDCLSRAHTTASNIDLVILTGGSTSIPYLMYTIRQIFPNAQISTSNRMSSVSLGLAYDAAMRYIV